MKRRIMLVVAFLVVLSTGVLAESRPLAIADFAIHSDNPNYKYIGKGISEMIAVELRKSPGIELIEREQRTQILEEMAFALSDLADSDQQLELGKLLAAGYIVFGEIIDMGREVLISLRMIDVQSGEIVWNEKLTEKLSKYDYISGYFAGSILTYLDVGISKTTAAKTEQSKEKSEDVVVALSRAIDHYDKQETEQAKEELSVAKRLDPRSEATAYYLAKLVVNTTKFKVLLEPYFSYQNPAFLGIIRTDSIHFSGTVPPAYSFANINRMQIDGLNMTSFADNKYINESVWGGSTGYAFPIGSKLGMRVDIAEAGISDRPWEGEYDSGLTNSRNAIGAVVDLGYALTERWSAGLGAGVFSRSKVDEGPLAAFRAPDKAVVSGNLGILYRKEDESLIFDTRLGINNDTYDVIDVETLNVTEETMTPMLWENTLTLSFNERNTFLIVKQINNVCYDRVYYYATLLPAVEHFLAKWISLRSGLEGSLSLLNDSLMFGYGLLGGVTFRNIKRGFEMDLNVTYRMRPSRAVEELLYPDLVVLLNLTWNDLFVSRE
jgi:TolB-like protein